MIDWFSRYLIARYLIRYIFVVLLKFPVCYRLSYNLKDRKHLSLLYISNENLNGAGIFNILIEYYIFQLNIPPATPVTTIQHSKPAIVNTKSGAGTIFYEHRITLEMR